MSVVDAPAGTRVAPTVPARRSDEWATVVFGTWMVAGLFLDGWAHGTQKPETFFSPWHGVLYSGFAAGMLYAAVDGYRTRRRGESYAMDRLFAAGIGLFALAGVGDMLWHQVFGIEVGIEALLSPSHLTLMTGGLLMASHPLRAAWSDPYDATRTRTLGTFVPTIVGVALPTALVSFFTMYASAFTIERLEASLTPAFDGATSHAVGAILLTNALFVLPMLVVLRRWTPPAGTFTVLFGSIGIAMTGLDGFERFPLAFAAVIGGTAADLAVRRLAVSPNRPRAVRAVTAIVPLALWVSYFAIHGVTVGLGWQPELWSGAIVLCVLFGYGLGLIVMAPATPQDLSRRAVS